MDKANRDKNDGDTTMILRRVGIYLIVALGLLAAPLATGRVSMKVDVILAVSPAAVRAARTASTTIPIIAWTRLFNDAHAAN